MGPIEDEIKKEIANGYIEKKEGCSYYPCHFDGQNCSLCYCPFYPCGDELLGKYVTSRKGGKVWSCQDCYWIHRNEVARDFFTLIKERGWDSLSHDDRLSLKKSLQKLHPRLAHSIMVMGTTSGAGKSLLVAALCRIFSDMGYNVAPYKSQNMSLNSFVTENGEEIARIQDLQARAARTRPKGYMNPILLKPMHDDVSQIMLYGKPYMDIDVKRYYSEFTLSKGLDVVNESVSMLKRLHEIVVIEGAGSPAEINMTDVEIANMKTAEAACAPCLLVVNLNWGGAFAYAFGTLALLPKEHRKMFKGIILNNMHGDASCLKSGIRELEQRTGIPVLGVVPHIELSLPDEDSMGLGARKAQGKMTIGIIRLPRISNFTDFDALRMEEGISTTYISSPMQLNSVDAVIIPGTKNTTGDLRWLKERGLFEKIRLLHTKIPIMGVCGGYQMLGKAINDPNNIESDETGVIEGLGLLECETTFDKYEKETRQVEGEIMVGEGGRIRGYEIHMGKTSCGEHSPLCALGPKDSSRTEGSCDTASHVYGTYIHGIFDLPAFRKYFVGLLEKGSKNVGNEESADYDAVIEHELDRLAETVKKSIDMDTVSRIMGLGDADE